jgi:hypothetical protein
MAMGEFKGAERVGRWRPTECGAGAGDDQPAGTQPGRPAGQPIGQSGGQAPLAAATWAATSAAKSSTFFSMPSPTMYSVKPLTWVWVDFR